MKKEQLLRVTSLVNNPMLDFTILELATSKRKIVITLKLKKCFNKQYGVIYKYNKGIEQFCKKNKIAFDIYDFNNNIDVLPKNKSNPLKTFDISIFNEV